MKQVQMTAGHVLAQSPTNSFLLPTVAGRLFSGWSRTGTAAVGRLRSWCRPSGESAGRSRRRERRTKWSVREICVVGVVVGLVSGQLGTVAVVQAIPWIGRRCFDAMRWHCLLMRRAANLFVRYNNTPWLDWSSPACKCGMRGHEIKLVLWDDRAAEFKVEGFVI